MNVLIVDDNTSNRVVLKLFLEEYEDNNKIKFNIKEAYNGFDAVEMCKNEIFNIVLMDIMMPKMDGIEATKLIREFNQDILIIAISAIEDIVRQKKILSNGAEDYISKPVSSEIFNSRISNYISIIDSRQNKKKSECVILSKVNLFTNKIYSKQIVFIIDSEDALLEFWEFFLLKAEAKYDNISDVVRILFSIVEIQLNTSMKPKIYIEESNNFQYFTLGKIDELQPKALDLILRKNPSKCEYRIKNEKISFKLSKIYFISEKIDNREKVIIADAQELEEEVIFESKELEVFNYMDDDDLIDLEEYANRLNSLMLIVGSGNVTEEEIIEIYSYLEKIGSVLTTYTEIYAISTALNSLSQNMSTYKDEFIKHADALGPMCSAFSNDLLMWINMSFHTGAPSVDFMNDTIAVNCDTISGMLKIDEQDDTVVEELDDIFDF